MAGLFMCLGIPRGLLGFDLGIPWFRFWESIFASFASILAPPGILSRIPLLPSELHLGFHLGSLGFDLGVPTLRQRQGISQHF